MIPFADVPPLHVGPLTVQTFGLTVVAAVLVGLAIARRRFARFGLDPALGERMATWLLVGGFLGAHLFAVLFYFPDEVARDPWLLVRVWEHISSFGGMIGGLLGTVLYLWVRAPGLGRHQRWAYLDVAAFVFPFSLAVGRVGCALVHDHPGRVTRFPLAVSLGERAGPGPHHVRLRRRRSGRPAPAVAVGAGVPRPRALRGGLPRRRRPARARLAGPRAAAGRVLPGRVRRPLHAGPVRARLPARRRRDVWGPHAGPVGGAGGARRRPDSLAPRAAERAGRVCRRTAPSGRRSPTEPAAVGPR